MGPLVQVGGAVLILAAFILAQARVLSPQSTTYLVLNLAGSAVLAVDAYVENQWGFVLLEGVWAMVSGFGLASRLLGRKVGVPH